MKELNKIAKGALITFFGLVFIKIIGYAYRLIIARIGVEEYGLYNLGFAVFSVICILSLVGMRLGVLRYVSYYKSKKDKKKITEVISSAIKINLPLSLFFSFLLFFYSPLISINIFHSPKLILVLRFFAFALPFFVLAMVFLSALQAFQKIKKVVYSRDILEGIVRISVTSLLIIVGYRLIGALIGTLIAIIAMFLLSFYYLKTLSILPLKSSLKNKLSKELFLYSLPVMFTGILVITIKWTDTLMLGYFLDPLKVGIYNVALPTANLLLLAPLSMQALFLPVTTELYALKKSFEKIYTTITKWIMFINFPLALLMIFFSKQIILIMFGTQYIKAALPLHILAFFYLLYSYSWTGRNILSILKKTKLIFFITLITAVCNIILNYALIPVYGINGAALATGLSVMLYGFLVSIFSYRYTKINPLSIVYIKMFFAGIISLILIYFLSNIFIVNKFYYYALIPMFILFIILYSVLFILLRGLEKEDKELLRAIKKKAKIKWIKF